MPSLDLLYRPGSLDEFYGSESMIKAVREYLKDADRKHTILLHGPSGCGKTTLGRIIAKELGSSLEQPNFLEFDLTLARGIKEAKERIVKTARYMPLTAPGESKLRVFLLDEAHQLTKDGASALLKTIEEPPEFVYFIFATTNPEKMLKTILTRCLKLEVQSLSDTDMKDLILEVAEAESIEMNQRVLRKMVDVSDGCPRDALNYLSSIRNIEDEDTRLELLSGGVNETEIIEICRILADPRNKAKWAAIKPKLSKLNCEPEKGRLAILGYFTVIIMNKGTKDNMTTYSADKASYFMEHNFNNGKAGLILSIYAACQED